MSSIRPHTYIVPAQDAIASVTTTGEEHHATPHGSSVEKADTSFFHGFFASLSVIIVSELGDKTFFIAAIMAMQHSRYGLPMHAHAHVRGHGLIHPSHRAFAHILTYTLNPSALSPLYCVHVLVAPPVSYAPHSTTPAATI